MILSSQKKGSAAKVIHFDIVAKLGYEAPDLSTASKWVAEFRTGMKRYNLPLLEGNIDCVLHKLMDDSPLTISQIAIDISITRESVENMLHKPFFSVGTTTSDT